MYKQITFILLLGISAGTAFADTQRANYQNSASAEATTGYISGLAVGGLVGGPPGAIFGAAVGAILGDGFFVRKRANVLRVELYESQLQVATLRDEALVAQQQMQQAMAELYKIKTSAAQVIPAGLSIASASPCCDNTVLSLHFRTGSSAIEPHYEEQLASLVKLANQMPAANVEITGYADRNGDADMNLRLSRERTASIKQYFNGMGIQHSSIITVAYGESQPLSASQSFEADFFDRRVIVRLRDSSKHMLTQLPDGE
ncbi:MAG TPA: sortase-associated OmpA-like protein PdsO [Porticoccaceae bacterium]|jgi:sortase system peptidoglycan-associated protein|nr:sortase-associated OmpA-like protein PdsO [Porticoccaceae bacterium]